MYICTFTTFNKEYRIATNSNCRNNKNAKRLCEKIFDGNYDDNDIRIVKKYMKFGELHD